MTNREFFSKRWESEQPAFIKVLVALPADQLAYRPHERSAAAGDLAWQMSEEQRSLCALLENGEIEWETRPRPETASEIVAAYESWTNVLRDRLASCDEERWQASAKFLMGGEAVSTSTIEEMFWGFLFDLIHHRGQLSTYIRPMGGKVPSIYGPSADDSGS